MKTRIIAPIVFITLSGIVSCNDDDESDKVVLKEDYCSSTSLGCTSKYPLVVGYLKKNDTESFEITGNKSIESKDYFVWSVKSQTDVTEYYDRIEGSKLFSRYKDTGGTTSSEFLVIDFDSDVNTEWEVDNYYGLGSAILKIESKSANMTIKNVTFSNAIKVAITFPSDPGSDYYEYYLPGLGFVKGKTELFEFHIGGVIYVVE